MHGEGGFPLPKDFKNQGKKNMLYTTLGLEWKESLKYSAREKGCLFYKLLVWAPQMGNYPSTSIGLPPDYILHNWSPNLKMLSWPQTEFIPKR